MPKAKPKRAPAEPSERRQEYIPRPVPFHFSKDDKQGIRDVVFKHRGVIPETFAEFIDDVEREVAKFSAWLEIEKKMPAWGEVEASLEEISKANRVLLEKLDRMDPWTQKVLISHFPDWYDALERNAREAVVRNLRGTLEPAEIKAFGDFFENLGRALIKLDDTVGLIMRCGLEIMRNMQPGRRGKISRLNFILDLAAVYEKYFTKRPGKSRNSLFENLVEICLRALDMPHEDVHRDTIGALDLISCSGSD